MPRGPGVDQERHSDSDQDARHHHIHIGARLRLALLALLGLDLNGLDGQLADEGGRADDAQDNVGEGDALGALLALACHALIIHILDAVQAFALFFSVSHRKKLRDSDGTIHPHGPHT